MPGRGRGGRRAEQDTAATRGGAERGAAGAAVLRGLLGCTPQAEAVEEAGQQQFEFVKGVAAKFLGGDEEDEGDDDEEGDD